MKIEMKWYYSGRRIFQDRDFQLSRKNDTMYFWNESREGKFDWDKIRLEKCETGNVKYTLRIEICVMTFDYKSEDDVKIYRYVWIKTITK